MKKETKKEESKEERNKLKEKVGEPVDGYSGRLRGGGLEKGSRGVGGKGVGDGGNQRWRSGGDRVAGGEKEKRRGRILERGL